MSAISPALADGVVRFSGVLRRAGLAVGTGQTLDAVRALAAVGVRRRDDVFWALHAVLVGRREDFPVFEQAFDRFWREPGAPDAALQPLFAGFRTDKAQSPPAGRRVAEALAAPPPVLPPRADDESQFDAVMSWSGREVLKTRDFEQMSAAELAEAAAMLRRYAMPLAAWPTRRHRADPRGGLPDLGASLRASARRGFDWLDLRYCRRREAPPPLVVLCDISGSMDRYARMFLRFVHALMRGGRRVHVFLFGTRLTNVTRLLKDRDIDVALAAVGAAVPDWGGGTRIGASLAAFNREWGRRVLARGAHVLLMTDGLDRDGGDAVAGEMQRLKLSCRRILWLNPLLRYAGFSPLAGGARAMIDHVDKLLPAYNIESLDGLAALLSGAARGRTDRHERRARYS